MALTAMVAAMLLGAGTRLLGAWLGSHDPQADVALVGLVFAAMFALATSTAAVMVRSAGRTDLEASLSAVALATHLGAAVLLIPRYQLLGAVAATLLGNIVACVFFLIRVSRAMTWDLGRTVLGGWALGNLIVSGIAAGQTEGSTHYFHQMNVGCLLRPRKLRYPALDRRHLPNVILPVFSPTLIVSFAENFPSSNAFDKGFSSSC